MPPGVFYHAPGLLADPSLTVVPPAAPGHPTLLVHRALRALLWGSGGLRSCIAAARTLPRGPSHSCPAMTPILPPYRPPTCVPAAGRAPGPLPGLAAPLPPALKPCLPYCTGPRCSRQRQGRCLGRCRRRLRGQCCCAGGGAVPAHHDQRSSAAHRSHGAGVKGGAG